MANLNQQMDCGETNSSGISYSEFALEGTKLSLFMMTDLAKMFIHYQLVTEQWLLVPR